jgi:hypothetical protein
MLFDFAPLALLWQRSNAFSAAKNGFSVAKVVKTFGCISLTNENLDEFRYRVLHRVHETGRGGGNHVFFANLLTRSELAFSNR